ncbi:MAG: ATP-binding protein, partial [Burkholderiaceae bacterium]|nr:ATP-binding protein [Burkholderiaceae bacterium]
MDSTNQQNQVSASVTAPGEGERRAIRGYIGQYDPAAVAIYMALDRGDLHWVGVADRTAGIADDLVLGLTGKVVAHQFKTSRFPDRFRVRTLLIGTNGLLRPLVVAWEALRLAHPGSSITIRLVTNDYPSTADSEADGASPHSAAFLVEFKAHPLRSLGEWRSSRWKQLIDDLFAASELTESDFDLFLSSLEILHGTDAEFASGYHLSADGVRLARDIAAILPRLVADKRDKDHWTRSELLHELGWRDSTVAHHVHQFPVGAYVQRNATTEAMLRDAIQRNLGGYVSLVGAPGAGKSTSLQISLEAVEDVFLVRYLAFIPGAGQGVGRGEADDFFDDIATQLKLTGLLGPRLHDQSLHERREQFSALIHAAGERFKADDVRTLIVIDGLDHVPREERPQRSFLAELPLPGAVPDGVLFILGTQRMNLDDIPPAVQDQASMVGRKVEMAPLSREAVHKMAQLLSLDADIDRDTIFALSHGHPLATRYLIEALRTADASIRDGLLAGAWTFDGDIEAVYESVWRGIRDDDKARSVLDYLARAEGPMPLELLVPLSSEAAIERALRAAGHLLSETEQGWSVFHNSFRLFILSKPRLRLGKPDSEYGIRLYRELAALARTAPGESPQHWLELRYTARAGDHASVLELATAVRFRQQFSERRSIPEIYADLRLAFEAARQTYDPLKVFQLLLTQNEMSRRWSVYEQVPTIVSAMLQVGDLDGAVAFVQHAPAAGYDVVDALLKAGQYARARALFQELEPLQQLLSGANFGNPPDQSELRDWVRRAIHFRDPEQIEQAILRLSKASHQESVLKDEQTAEHVADSLRLHAALAAIGTRDNDDVAEIGRQFGVDAALWGYLTIEAGLVAAERG